MDQLMMMVAADADNDPLALELWATLWAHDKIFRTDDGIRVVREQTSSPKDLTLTDPATGITEHFPIADTVHVTLVGAAIM